MKNSSVFVSGHRGMLGSSVIRMLCQYGVKKIVTVDGDLRSFGEYPKQSVDYAIVCAAKVGGILANVAYPADFLRTNALIQLNALDWARSNAGKIILIGSSCIYPKDIGRDILPSDLLGGHLEETNKAYAISKIMGIIAAQAYSSQYGINAITCMPCNLYGPGDNYTSSSHVIAALISKVFNTENDFILVGGTGKPRREFLYVDDCALAIIKLLLDYNGTDPVNIGSGDEVSIDELARMIINESGKNLTIKRDLSIPDGVKSKKLDSSVMRNMGWSPSYSLQEGIKLSIADYLSR